MTGAASGVSEQLHTAAVLLFDSIKAVRNTQSRPPFRLRGKDGQELSMTMEMDSASCQSWIAVIRYTRWTATATQFQGQRQARQAHRLVLYIEARSQSVVFN